MKRRLNSLKHGTVFFKINFASSFESCGFRTVFQKELASPSTRMFTRSWNERITTGSDWSMIHFYQPHHTNFLFPWWIETQRMTFQNEYQTFCLRDVASTAEIILRCKRVYISGRLCGRTFGQYSAFSFSQNLRRTSSWAPRKKSTMSVIFSLKLQKNTGNHQFILSGCGGCARRFFSRNPRKTSSHDFEILPTKTCSPGADLWPQIFLCYPRYPFSAHSFFILVSFSACVW